MLQFGTYMPIASHIARISGLTLAEIANVSEEISTIGTGKISESFGTLAKECNG